MIKRLSKCIREYKLPSILAPIFIALEVILEVFIPMIMGLLIDNGIEKSNTSYVVKMGFVLVISASPVVTISLAPNHAIRIIQV